MSISFLHYCCNVNCLQIRAEELSHSKTVFVFHSNGLGLDKKDFFGKSDPYLQFEKQNQDGSYTVVHRTTVS